MAPETIILLIITVGLVLTGHVLAHPRLLTSAIALSLPFWATGLFSEDITPAYELGISAIIILAFVDLSRRRVYEDKAYWHPVAIIALEAVGVVLSINQLAIAPMRTLYFDLAGLTIYTAQLALILNFARGIVSKYDFKRDFDLFKRLKAKPQFALLRDIKEAD